MELIDLVNPVTDRLVNSIIIFLSQMTLFRWLTLLLGSLNVTLRLLLSWIYLFLLMPVIVLQWLPLLRKFWSCCSFSFQWLLVKLKIGCPASSCISWLFLCWLGGFSDHLRCYMRGNLLLLLLNSVNGFMLHLITGSLHKGS